MAKIDDGGSAFPQPGEQFDSGDRIARSWDNPGMSLRDWFAGQALIGIFSSRHMRNDAEDAEIAAEAYAISDALLRARVAQSPADRQADHLREFGK